MDLLVNGHFDEKVLPGAPYMFNDTEINGWTAVNGGQIELWGSGACGIHTHTYSGNYIELDVYNDATLDGVYQDVATTKGSIYLLTFYMHARHDSVRLTDNEALTVEWNGESLGRFVSSRPNAWTKYQLTVIGTGGLDRLAFLEVSSSGQGPLLDDVSLYERTSLLINGLFDEKFNWRPAPYLIKDSNIPGWTSSSSGKIELWVSGACGIQSHTGTGKYIELDHLREGPLDGVYQDVVATNGQAYILTFYMRARREAKRTTDDEALTVEWNGVSLGQFISTEPNAWTRYQLSITGAAGLNRLLFLEVSSDGQGPLLDDVSIIEI